MLRSKSVNASEPSDVEVEESLVDSAIKGRQNDNKSNQDSPVSVKDAPGKSAPSNVFFWILTKNPSKIRN